MVTLVAELDTTSSVVIVADLKGCAHADTFAKVDVLTLEQTWALIDAALTAFEGRGGRGRRRS